MIENIIDTSVAKHVFNTAGDPVSAEVMQDLFPGAEIVVNVPGQGMIVKNGKRVEAVVRGKGWIPLANYDNGTKFGGQQTTAHVELNYGQEFGISSAAEIAQSVVTEAKRGKGPRAGLEWEAWTHDSTGTLYKLPEELQVELQSGLSETAMGEPAQSIPELAVAHARDILARPKVLPDLHVIDTSTPIAGNLANPGAGMNSGEGEQYVMATATKLRSFMGSPDTYAHQVGDALARSQGYSSFEEMRDSRADISYWLAAAAHESVELPHVQDEEGEHRVPLEIGIAVADLFNSDFATVAEWLNYSTPLMLGQKAEVVTTDGQKHTLRDARAALRYIMTTAYPSPFIGTVDELHRRWETLIGEDHVATADRASFIAQHPGQDGEMAFTAAVHSRVRLRLATKSRKHTIGRVEFTGKGSTPSLLDEMASNALVRLLAISAHEAIANGQHPKEYFAEKYPSMASWEHQRDLAHEYNIYGVQGKNVQRILGECKAYLSDMEANYPGLKNEIALVRQRVENMAKPTVAATLEEYAFNPQGSISEVISTMADNGVSPAKIVEAVAKYQRFLAERVIHAYNHGKDVFAVLGVLSQRR